MEQTCLWWATAPEPKSYLNKPLPEKADVVVIGGGFTGTSAALQLAKNGANVVLLEAESIGWGASSRNGGQALSCLHYPLHKMIKLYGRELAKEMFLAAVKAADTVEQIVTEEKIDCDYARSGNIEAASRPAHFEVMKREQEALRDVADYGVQVLEKQEIASELGTGVYHGALINPRSGSVQPAKFVRGMALAAERSGADIHEGTRVLGIDRQVDPVIRNGIRFTVRTNRGNIEAKEILLAANAWAGNILPQFRRRVFPVDSYVIATEPLPAELAGRLIRNSRVVYDTRRVLAYYRLSPDGRMVWGGEATFTGASPQVNINVLKKGMLHVFPDLADFKLDYYWSGTLGLTLDETTHAGQVDGIWYSMCYVGHGVTLATYMGRQMANGILGLPNNNPFDGLHIPRVPLFQDSAWLGNLGKFWYGLLDKIG